MIYCEDCDKQISFQLDVCPDCDNPLQQLCSECDIVLPLSANFCSNCGNQLVNESSPSLKDNLQLSTGRRHITVLFCDLVGSTGLSTQLDPEDLSDLLVMYRNLCMRIVKKWDGYVADFQGDGVMIYFGYPVAHEDDSQRAVHAALEITEQVKNISFQSEQVEIELAVRIGINSGRAVIGDIGEGEVVENMGIVGETPNIAAKLQSKASDNEIILSESTYRQIKGFFNCDYLGKQQIKGVAKQVTAYRVKAAIEHSERFQGERFGAIKTITGRDKELSQLRKCWRKCEQGEFKSIVITGEAGIGKSRLLWAFRQWLNNQQRKVIVFNCSPYHTQTALYPFVEVLSRGGNKDRAKTTKRLKVLIRQFNCFDEGFIDTTIALLVDFIYGRDIQVDPAKYKNRIYNALRTISQALAQKAPLLIVVEDLHWIDPTTWEFFLKFLASKRTTDICLLVTSRDKAHAELPVDLSLELNPLSAKQSTELVNNVIKAVELPSNLLDQLINSCNGNPLYLEESARYLSEIKIFEQDSPKNKSFLAADTISFAPESLNDLFMSRLDRLSQEKWLAQLASAIGNQFEVAILKAVAQIETEYFNKALKRLIDADIFRQVEGSNLQLLGFKHVLLRNATHDALLRTQRQFIHQKIIDVYLAQQPQLQDQQPELLAYHHAQAGNSEQAILCWELAGIKAKRLSANVEAVSHFRKALDLIHEGNDPKRHLSLLIQMGPSLMAVESWASAQVETLYMKSIELSRELDDNDQLFAGLRGLWGNNFLRGDLVKANHLSTQLESLAADKKSDELKIESVLSRAMEKYWLGDFYKAQKGLNKVSDLYDHGIHKEHAYVFSVDPGVVSLFYQSRTLWALGFPDQSLEKVKSSIALAHDHEHYPSLSWGLGFYAAVHFDRGEYELALEIAKQGATLSHKHDFPLWEAWGHVLSGSASIALHRQDYGIKEIEEGIHMYNSTGAAVALPYFYSLEALSLLKLKHFNAALKSINKASVITDNQSINSIKAELLRLKAVALWGSQAGNKQEVIELLMKSTKVARQQRAKSLELRALLTQAELMGEETNDSILELAELYKWFSEGFDTLDLRKATNWLN